MTKEKTKKRAAELKKIPMMSNEELEKLANKKWSQVLYPEMIVAAKKEIIIRKKYYEFKIKIIHFNVIKLFLELIEDSFDVQNFDKKNIEFNNNKYNMYYNYGNLLIEYDNGKKINLIIGKNSSYETDGYFRSWISTWNDATIKFELSTGEYISFNSRDTYNIINDELIKIYYGNKNQNKVKLEWDLHPECINKNTRGNFTYNGCFLVSNDLSRIISINNIKIPDYDNIKELNAISDINEIKEFIKNSKLSSTSINILNKSIKSIEKKSEEYQEILKYYDEVLPTIKNLLKIQDRAINISDSFNDEELNYLYNVFERAVEEKRRESELEEEKEKSPNNRMKKLVKSLSAEELTALKNSIND